MPGTLLTIRAVVSRLGLLAVSTLALAGCQSIQGSTTVSATLRVVDVSPNSGGLDFYLNKNVLVYNVGSPSSTNYVPLSSGTYSVAATLANNSVSSALATTTLTVATGKQYTVLAGNIPASLELTALTDQNTPAPSGNVALRILDQSSAVGSIDIYLVAQGGKLITTNPFLTGVTFDSNSGYVNLPAGTYSVIIVPNGTIPIATTVATYTGALKTYNAGVVDTLVIRDLTLTTSNPLDVMYLTDYTPPGS